MALAAKSCPGADSGAAPEVEPALLAHLNACEPCRRYLTEMSNLAGRLTVAANDLSEPIAPSNLHRRVLRALESTAAAPGRKTASQAQWAGWRILLPALGVALAMALAILYRGSMAPKTVAQNSYDAAPVAAHKQPLPDPTASEYLLVAGRSLDQLDELLNRQARQNLPPAPALKLITLLHSEQ